MNNLRFDEEPLRPTYMSQAEANEVMQLWEERQREEAARQSMITVHDVAEATQLPVQEIERLLQEVRTSRPGTVKPAPQAYSPTPAGGREPTLWEAYVRLAPATGVVTMLMAWYMHNHLMYFGWGPGYPGLYQLWESLFFYSFAMAFIYVRRRFLSWYRTSPGTKLVRELQASGFRIR